MMNMTPYQILRAILDGKSVYIARKGRKLRAVWSYSAEQVQRKFPGWDIF